MYGAPGFGAATHFLGRDVGGFGQYIGKTFLIRCRQDERFAVDTCQNQGNGGDIIIWEANPSNPNQIWTVDFEGHIINVANPHAMIYARGGSSDNCHLAITGVREGGAYRMGNLSRWSLTPEGEIVCLDNPNQMMNVAGARMVNRADLITWHRQGPGARNDKWRIDVVGTTAPTFGGHPLGELRNFVRARFFIRAKFDPSYVADTAVKQRQGGGDAHLWSDTRNMNPNQIWTLDEYGHILNAENPNMALVAVSCTEGAHVGLCDMTNAMYNPLSRWTMNNVGEISPLANPDLLLNVCGGQMKNGAALILWRRQGANARNDKWSLEIAAGMPMPGMPGMPGGMPMPGMPGMPPMPGMPGMPGMPFAAPNLGELRNFVGTRFTIRCRFDGSFCADTANKQRQGGGDVHLWSDTRNMNPNQLWTLDQFGHIINAENPRDLMALVPVRCEEGAHVALTRMSSAVVNTPLAMWTMNPQGEIVNQSNPNLMLNVCGGQLRNGAALILWRRQGPDARNDKWMLNLA